jgi:hypothetical protein
VTDERDERSEEEARSGVRSDECGEELGGGKRDGDARNAKINAAMSGECSEERREE